MAVTPNPDELRLRSQRRSAMLTIAALPLLIAVGTWLLAKGIELQFANTDNLKLGALMTHPINRHLLAGGAVAIGVLGAYLFLPNVFRLLAWACDIVWRRADTRTLFKTCLVIFLAVLLVSGQQIVERTGSAETRYLLHIATQLIGVVIGVVLIVAVITWLTLLFFDRSGRRLLAGNFVLFTAWRFLRSHRDVDGSLHGYRGGRTLSVGKALVIGAVLSGLWAITYSFTWHPLFPGANDVADTVRLGLVVAACVVFTWPVRTLIRHLFRKGDGPKRSNFSNDIGKVDWLDHTQAWLGRTPGRKSVTATTFISIVGVGVGVWALIVVLSVMGGFKQDLRAKILSTTPHVLIQDSQPMAGIPNVHTMLRQMRRVGGVTAAIPYVQGDVIISSAQNRNMSLTLKGIVPAELAGTDHHLLKNVIKGDLAGLTSAERVMPLTNFAIEGVDPGITTPGLAPATAPEDTHSEDGEGDVEEDGDEGDDIEPDAIAGVNGVTRKGPKEDLYPGIIIGKELAFSLHVNVGQEVILIAPREGVGFLGVQARAKAFRVAGIFDTGMYEYDLKLAYVHLSEAQRFFNMGSDINRIELRLADVDASKVATFVTLALTRLLGADSLTVDDWKTLNAQLFAALQLEEIVMFVVLGFIILVASFNIISSLVMIILEKANEISILRSMGATRNSLRRLFLILGTFIGFIGSMAGMTVGVLTCVLIDLFGLRLPRQYYIEHLPVHIDPLTIGTIFLAGIGISLLATIYPAVSASRVSPVEGLRYE